MLAVVGLALSPMSSLAGTRTETFPSALGDRFEPVGSPNANGAGGNLNNFGFSSSTHAGGALGEGGGEFSRSGFPLHAYADTNLGVTIGRSNTLVMSGKFNVDGNFGFDGFAFLGYFDAVTSGTASPFLGIRLQEPGNGFDGFRARLWIREANGSDSVSAGTINIELGPSKTFDLAYAANPDGSGTLSGTIDGESISVTAGASSTTFNAYGMGAGFFNNDFTGPGLIYYDDLTYTTFVPETTGFSSTNINAAAVDVSQAVALNIDAACNASQTVTYGILSSSPGVASPSPGTLIYNSGGSQSQNFTLNINGVGVTQLTTTNDGGCVNPAAATVNVIALDSLDLQVPGSTQLVIGQTRQATVTGTFGAAGSRTITANPATIYLTTNAAVATVSSGGLITAVAAGSVSIIASNGVGVDSVVLLVVPPDPNTRTETFPSEAGSQFAPVGTPRANGAGDDYCNFGFSSSSHAGGALGEGGGEFARRGYPGNWYADTNLNGTFARSTNLVMSGKFNIDGNVNTGAGFTFDGFHLLGYFGGDGTEGNYPFLGIRMQEPQGGVNQPFRCRLWARSTDGSVSETSSEFLISQGAALTLDLTYFANPDGSGVFSGTVAGTAVNLNVSASADVFHSFGMGTSYFANDPTGAALVYYDDLTYSHYPDTTIPSLTIINTSTNAVVVTWPSPSTGFVLEDNTDLTTTNWMNVGLTPGDDGTNKSVTITPATGNRYYRLKN